MMRRDSLLQVLNLLSKWASYTPWLKRSCQSTIAGSAHGGAQRRLAL